MPRLSSTFAVTMILALVGCCLGGSSLRAAKPAWQSKKAHTDHVSMVAFSPDGKTLASCSNDKTVKLCGQGLHVHGFAGSFADYGDHEIGQLG